MNKFLKKIKDLFVSAKVFISEHKNSLAKGSIYTVIVLFFYFMFLFFLLPYNEIVGRLSDEIRNKTSINVSVRRSGGTFPFGLNLSDVVVTKRFNGNEYPLLEARTIKIVPGILSLLKGWISLSVYARLYNGQAWMDVSSNRKDFIGKCMIKGIYIDKYSLLKSNYGLNIDGILDAKIDIRGVLNDVTKDRGNINIKIKHMVFNPSKILDIFILPKMELGDVNIPIYIKDGKLVFQDAGQNSKDINSKLEGSVMLLTPISNSILNLKLKFNPSPELEQQIKRAIPIFTLTRDASGYFVIPITGNLAMPMFE